MLSKNAPHARRRPRQPYFNNRIFSSKNPANNLQSERVFLIISRQLG